MNKMLTFLIWSNEHQGFWNQSRWGYTTVAAGAGRFDRRAAEEITKDANIVNPNAEILVVAPESVERLEAAAEHAEELRTCLSVATQVLDDLGAGGSLMGRFRKALKTADCLGKRRQLTGPFRVEPHGQGWAIYKGRDSEHHGQNLGHLTECSDELAELIEKALNVANQKTGS